MSAALSRNFAVRQFVVERLLSLALAILLRPIVLEARPVERGEAHRFSRDARLNLRGDRFACARARKCEDERLPQAASRGHNGNEETPR
ncbi:MAG: hypothetical protein ABR878_11195 [Roseiarcus sp.]